MRVEHFLAELAMQTLTRRIFLFGVCIIAFYILALNSHIAELIFLLSVVLAFFVFFTFIVLATRLTIRYNNKKQLCAMRSQMKCVTEAFDKSGPIRMPPGSMHEMHPHGDCSEWLDRISESVTVFETRQESLDEAESLHYEIRDLQAELMQLWARALQGMPFPELK